jgi:hypothetical protein
VLDEDVQKPDVDLPDLRQLPLDRVGDEMEAASVISF